MQLRFVLSSFLFLTFFSFGQDIPLYKQNQTHDFQQTINAYRALENKFPEYCLLQEIGTSDYGIPVPLFIINSSGIFTEAEYSKKTVLLINNGIHPGEPCGVDACIELAENIISTPSRIPKDVVIAIIPIYNIGGAHNRNCCSRANQNGPETYGFRGNSKNLDLNRDFIKADSENTLAFHTIFHLLKPAIFVDTHTSNGADYQHTMTLITSQINKMSPRLAEYTTSTLNPYLFDQMEKDNLPMVPYVHSIDKIPDNGIVDYLETPRYSTGYTNLFSTISYVTEAHMLKPYQDRVIATRTFLEHLIDFMQANSNDLIQLKKNVIEDNIKQEYFALNWKLDTNIFEKITFNGYKAEYKKSEVTQLQRLYYNRDKPYTKLVNYYNHYAPITHIKAPTYYVIPQTWKAIIKLLLVNNIAVLQLKETTTLLSETYYIDSYQTSKSPFEGHYLHYDVQLLSEERNVVYRKGDYIIPVKNESIRFIIETLEPNAPDSYFAWNYFDAILQQKEWFSSYVFEDEAAEMLKNDIELKKEFDQKKELDSAFAKDSFAQLYYLYKRSPHYEATKNLYPITRINTLISPDILTEVSSTPF